MMRRQCQPQKYRTIHRLCGKAIKFFMYKYLLLLQLPSLLLNGNALQNQGRFTFAPTHLPLPLNHGDTLRRTSQRPTTIATNIACGSTAAWNSENLDHDNNFDRTIESTSTASISSKIPPDQPPSYFSQQGRRVHPSQQQQQSPQRQRQQQQQQRPRRPTNTPFDKTKRWAQKDEICALFRQAKTLERTGQWRTAVQLYQQILSIDPMDAHSYLALARLQAKGGDDTAAQSIFITGTTACPDCIHLWQAWAVYEQTTTYNMTQAQHLFQRALEIDPCSPYVCHAYGLMERKLGNTQLAVELWERALQRTSTAALVCSLGELFIAENKFTQARDLYSRHVHRVSSEREKIEVYLAWAWLEERYFSNLDQAEELLTTALRLSPQSTLAQVALARLDGRRQQQLHTALDGTTSSVVRPTGTQVRNATARRLASVCIKFEQQNSDTAVTQCHSRDEPADGRIYNAWANLEVKAKRLHEARKILYRGLARYPTDHSLLQAAGKVEERMGNLTGARELYGASLSVQPSAPTLVAYALLDLRYPTTAASGPVPNFNATKRLFEEALMVDRRHGPAYNAYARAVAEYEDEDAARCIFERGLRANCTDAASIYHGYARLELSLGNVNRARELLLEGHHAVGCINVGTDSPHRERALFLTHTLGMLELNSNRPSIALDVFVNGIDQYGNSSQLLLGAALCSIKLGNERKAREWFEQSVVTDEKHAQAWQAWGMMEMRAGNLKTAKTLFECGIRSTPRHGALWHAYGVLESRLGNTEASRILFEKGINVAPNHVALYHSWASLELRDCNYSAAKALIAQALTRDKQNGAGWMIAADIEERMGNHGLSILLLQRGIECCPTNNAPHLYRALGDALVRQGKILEAREVLEQGIDVDPMYAPLYHSLAELEARIFNVEGLAKLNKRAASIFNNNVLEAGLSSSDAWGSKIKAGQSQRSSLPTKSVAALARRIAVDDESRCDVQTRQDGVSSTFNRSSRRAESSTFLDGLISSYYLDGSLMDELLEIGQQNTTSN
jgi:tetratricopeptide (TPR) repeat protein